MNRLTRRIAGYTLIAAAVIGVIISITDIIFIKSYIDKTRELVGDTIGSVHDLLALTNTTLDDLNTAVDKVSSSMDSLQGMAEGISDAVDSAGPTLDELSSLVGDDLPLTIRSLQSSLESGATSAMNIDSVLNALSRIPLLGTIVYNPDQPLSESLEYAAASLGSMPDSLAKMQEGINTANDNLKDANFNLAEVTESIGAIKTSIGQAKTSITRFKTLESGFEMRMVTVINEVDRFLNLLFFVTIGSLIWLLLAQLSLFIQGLNLLNANFLTEAVRENEQAIIQAISAETDVKDEPEEDQEQI